MSNQIQSPNVKMFSKTISYVSFSHCVSSPVYAAFELMGRHIFFSILHLTFISQAFFLFSQACCKVIEIFGFLDLFYNRNSSSSTTRMFLIIDLSKHSFIACLTTPPLQEVWKTKSAPAALPVYRRRGPLARHKGR